MTKPNFTIYKAQNNAKPQLQGNIGSSDTNIALQSGHGNQLPTIYTGAASSTGDRRTLNDTGDLGDLAVGDILWNKTDDSWAVVLDISGAPNSVITTPLKNGTDNTWSSGDTWMLNPVVGSLTQLNATTGAIDKQERVLITVHTAAADSVTVQRGFGGDTQQTFNDSDYLYIMVLNEHVEELAKAIRAIYMEIEDIHNNVHGFSSDASNTDTYAITSTPPITSYAQADGRMWLVRITNANTGAATLNVDSKGAKSVVKPDAAGAFTALEANDIAADSLILVGWDNTNDQFVLLSSASLAGGFSALTVQAKTTDYSISDTNDIAYVFTNEGSTGEADAPQFTLPAASAGLNFKIVCAEDEYLYILPSSGDEIWSAATQYGFGIRANTKYSSIELLAINDTQWIINEKEGTWENIENLAYWVNGASQQTKIRGFLFSTETINDRTAVLTNSHQESAGIGDNVIGAALGRGTNISFLHLYTEETWTGASALPIAIIWACGVSSSSAGYILGSSASGIETDDVLKVIFATEATSTLSSVLNVDVGESSTLWDDEDGYTLGGRNNTNNIQRFNFSSETGATVTDDISTARKQLDGGVHEGLINGYIAGGTGYSNVIEELVFATEIVSPVSGTLGTARQDMGGISDQNGGKGYFAGGYNGSAQSAIDDITFSSGASATISETLDTADYDLTGFDTSYVRS